MKYKHRETGEVIEAEVNSDNPAFVSVVTKSCLSVVPKEYIDRNYQQVFELNVQNGVIK